MKLIINGTTKEIPDNNSTVTLLLSHLQIGQKKAVVERNGNILVKEQHDNEPVKDGDKFEIVHFVGGG
ncbi:sulfur carrier protein ThiS [Alteribacillus bidgolensis]|uniref:Sulfur carrier protein n=1 Tax=Alteribacillus bidgolensis TaxID=930129 RepID=A0A1G8ILS1_9BACI|nr:sulfur carrier protein ThiS [Alteribacillus bidgolensis]SDI19845.1 sulfur carrier protein [Alteribacillus bidgolensis]